GTVEEFAKLVHPADAARVSAALRAAMEERQPYDSVDFRTIPPDGQVRWLSTTGQVFFDSQGRPVRMLGMTIDVTDARRAQDAIRESEERMRAVFEQSAAGISQLDLSGKFIQVNQCYCDLVGYTREELLGRSMPQITHPDDIQRNLALIEDAVKNNRGYRME